MKEVLTEKVALDTKLKIVTYIELPLRHVNMITL